MKSSWGFQFGSCSILEFRPWPDLKDASRTACDDRAPGKTSSRFSIAALGKGRDDGCRNEEHSFDSTETLRCRRPGKEHKTLNPEVRKEYEKNKKTKSPTQGWAPQECEKKDRQIQEWSFLGHFCIFQYIFGILGGQPCPKDPPILKTVRIVKLLSIVILAVELKTKELVQDLGVFMLKTGPRVVLKTVPSFSPLSTLFFGHG